MAGPREHRIAQAEHVHPHGVQLAVIGVRGDERGEGGAVVGVTGQVEPVAADVCGAAVVDEAAHNTGPPQGGLRFDGSRAKALEAAIAKLKKARIGISAFVDPTPSAIRAAYKIGADTVELCTTTYANATGKKGQEDELEALSLASHLAHELGLSVHAGHDLNYHNVGSVAKIPHMEALNIGFSIISRAVFIGLRQAVAEMSHLINQ